MTGTIFFANFGKKWYSPPKTSLVRDTTSKYPLVTLVFYLVELALQGTQVNIEAGFLIHFSVVKMGKGFTTSLRCGQAWRLPIASMACRAFVSTGAMGLQGDKMKDDKHAIKVGMVGGVFVPLVV